MTFLVTSCMHKAGCQKAAGLALHPALQCSPLRSVVSTPGGLRVPSQTKHSEIHKSMKSLHSDGPCCNC